MIGRLLATTVLVAACGRDVQLGRVLDARPDAPPDAPPDGSGNPFTPGVYTWTFGTPFAPVCMGTLLGQDAVFAAITPASLGIASGAVTLTTPNPTTLTVTGAPITTALLGPSIDLTHATNNPDQIWDGMMTGDFSSGPDSTTRISTDLALDITTATSPVGIGGQLAILYTTLDSMGVCTVGFPVLLSH